MRTLLERLAGIALALCAALGAHARATVAYTIVDLGDSYRISGFQSKVLNDHGQIIGNKIGGAAYLYTSGSWNQLGQLNASGTANNATVPQGVNNLGMVVGQSDTGVTNGIYSQTDGFFQAGVSGSLTALGLVTATNSNQVAIAYGCNDLGTIVGNAIDYGAGTRTTFLYVPGTGIVSNTNDGNYSFAIDRFGDVLGSTIGLTQQAVLNGAPLPSSTAGFTPQAINNSGQVLLSVAGTHQIAGGWGIIYNYGTGKTTSLGNLSSQSAGYTAFLDINDAGDVVGRGSDAGANPHAVLYTPAGGMISLDALGLAVSGTAVHLTEAEGINNNGQIVCTGYTTDSTDIHGYLLTPQTVTPLPLAATYDGLAALSGSNVGAVTITIGKTNTATVKLIAPGVTYSFKVTLTGSGFSGTASSKGTALNVALQTDAANHVLSGTVAGTASYTFAALRQAPLGVSAGKYTALLQISGTSSPVPPQGIGYGQMTVSKTGMVTIKGKLGDGTSYSAAAKSHYDGSWTFYAPLYTKTPQPGWIAGSMAINRAAAGSDYLGTLLWSDPGLFATNVTCQAALFKAVSNTQLLRFTDTTTGTATFAFAGGGVTLAPHTLSVTNKNIVTVTDPGADSLAVTLSTSTGAMTGTFINPAVPGTKTKFSGVVQQKLNLGGGVFMGQTTAGSALLTPQ